MRFPMLEALSPLSVNPLAASPWMRTGILINSASKIAYFGLAVKKKKEKSCANQAVNSSGLSAELKHSLPQEKQTPTPYHTPVQIVLLVLCIQMKILSHNTKSNKPPSL